MAAMTDTRVKPHVRAAAQEIADTFGITNIGGFASSGHIEDSDHYKGLAIDVMTVSKGQIVANWAVANSKRLSITYVIWNRHIWDSRDGKGWVPYVGTSPHTDHVHISFFPTAAQGFSGSLLPPLPNGMPADGTGGVGQGCITLLKGMFGL